MLKILKRAQTPNSTGAPPSQACHHKIADTELVELVDCCCCCCCDLLLLLVLFVDCRSDSMVPLRNNNSQQTTSIVVLHGGCWVTHAATVPGYGVP
jgi:hypothetical protein